MASFRPHRPPEDCINCEHRHLRVFCNLTPPALQDYDGIGIITSHVRGAKLFTEGDAARNVFVICYGQVKISSTSRDGKTMILKIAGPGDVTSLPQGHDAWVIGDEPVVVVDWFGATNYAKRN